MKGYPIQDSKSICGLKLLEEKRQKKHHSYVGLVEKEAKNKLDEVRATKLGKSKKR